MPKVSLKPSAGQPSARGLRMFCVLLLFPVLLPAEPLSAQPKNALTCLTNAQQVRVLDPETAGKNLPVHMFGVVTYYDAPLFNLFFQDATAGIFVLVAPNISTNIAAGQEIEMEGVSDKGDYAPIVKASAIRVLGKAQLPVPRRVTIDQLSTGCPPNQ